MNKPCARPECGKIVYPMDELKCLDKVWHKQCFRCGVCGMVLNMKNYRGYERVPYCEPHYPKTKASVIADTPENRRLAENTKNQSLVKYHEDFEKTKGKKMEIPDDPEVQRHLKNTQIVSQVAYHGDIDRKEHMEKIRPPMEETIAHRDYDGSEDYFPQEPVQQPLALINQIEKAKISDDYYNGSGYHPSSYSNGQPQTYKHHFTEPYLLAPNQMTPQPTMGQPLHTAGFVPAQKSPQQKSPTHVHQQQPAMQQSQRLAQAAQQQPKFSPPPQQQQPQVKRPPSAGQGTVVRAMYDYTAADTDEISFNEGDIIVNCQRVDEGWMTGTVQRTGKFGMLPANYVERVH